MLPYKGKPMLQHNLEKCLELFDRVYVSSDSDEILKFAESFGALPIKRGEELCGDVPDIPVYKHALEQMEKDGLVEGIVAVHVDTPDVDPITIQDIRYLLELNFSEVMTCHPMTRDKHYHRQANKIYGSVRGLSVEALKNYGDPYYPYPEVLVVDPTPEIETPEDYAKYNV